MATISTPTPYNVGGSRYNSNTPKERNTMFENVINEQAIADLTPEEAATIMDILEKAGY